MSYRVTLYFLAYDITQTDIVRSILLTSHGIFRAVHMLQMSMFRPSARRTVAPKDLTVFDIQQASDGHLSQCETRDLTHLLSDLKKRLQLEDGTEVQHLGEVPAVVQAVGAELPRCGFTS